MEIETKSSESVPIIISDEDENISNMIEDKTSVELVKDKIIKHSDKKTTTLKNKTETQVPKIKTKVDTINKKTKKESKVKIAINSLDLFATSQSQNKTPKQLMLENEQSELLNKKLLLMKRISQLEASIQSGNQSLSAISSGNKCDDLLLLKAIDMKPSNKSQPLHLELLHDIGQEWNCSSIHVSMIIQLWYYLNYYHTVFSIQPFSLNQLYQSLLTHETDQTESQRNNNSNIYIVHIIGQRLVDSILVDYDYDLEDTNEDEKEKEKENEDENEEDEKEEDEKEDEKEEDEKEDEKENEDENTNNDNDKTLTPSSYNFATKTKHYDYHDALTLESDLCTDKTWYEITHYLFFRHLTDTDINMKEEYQTIVDHAKEISKVTDWYNLEFVDKLGVLYGLLQISLTSICIQDEVYDRIKAKKELIEEHISSLQQQKVQNNEKKKNTPVSVSGENEDSKQDSNIEDKESVGIETPNDNNMNENESQKEEEDSKSKECSSGTITWSELKEDQINFIALLKEELENNNLNYVERKIRNATYKSLVKTENGIKYYHPEYLPVYEQYLHMKENQLEERHRLQEEQKRKQKEEKKEKQNRDYKKQMNMLNVNFIPLGRDRYYNLYWGTPLLKDILLVAVNTKNEEELNQTNHNRVPFDVSIPLEEYEKQAQEFCHQTNTNMNQYVYKYIYLRDLQIYSQTLNKKGLRESELFINLDLYLKELNELYNYSIPTLTTPYIEDPLAQGNSSNNYIEKFSTYLNEPVFATTIQIRRYIDKYPLNYQIYQSYESLIKYLTPVLTDDILQNSNQLSETSSIDDYINNIREILQMFTKLKEERPCSRADYIFTIIEEEGYYEALVNCKSLSALAFLIQFLFIHIKVSVFVKRIFKVKKTIKKTSKTSPIEENDDEMYNEDIEENYKKVHRINKRSKRNASSDDEDNDSVSTKESSRKHKKTRNSKYSDDDNDNDDDDSTVHSKKSSKQTKKIVQEDDEEEEFDTSEEENNEDTSDSPSVNPYKRNYSHNNHVSSDSESNQFTDDSEEDDDWNECCRKCHRPGRVILCDGCDRMFHPHCVGLTDIPKGKWFCPFCTKNDHSENESDDSDYDTTCTECGKEDMSDKSNPFIHCSGCSASFHLKCTNLRRVPENLKEWLCSSCRDVRNHQIIAEKMKKKNKTNVIESESEENNSDDEFEWDSECFKCNLGGNLLCCDHCTRSYHLKCVGLRRVPEGEWICPECEKERCPICQEGGLTNQTRVCCYDEDKEEGCQRTFHIKCVGLESVPKIPWICQDCKNKTKENQITSSKRSVDSNDSDDKNSVSSSKRSKK